MAEVKNRTRRSKEERVEELKKKIASHEDDIEKENERHKKVMKYHKSCIDTMNAKIDKLLNPPVPKPRKKKATIKNIISIAKKQGLTEAEIAGKLGIKIDD